MPPSWVMSICGGLRGDSVDVGDRDRSSFAGGEQADRSPNAYRRVVLIVGLLTPADDEQAAALQGAVATGGAGSGLTEMSRQRFWYLGAGGHGHRPLLVVPRSEVDDRHLRGFVEIEAKGFG